MGESVSEWGHLSDTKSNNFLSELRTKKTKFSARHGSSGSSNMKLAFERDEMGEACSMNWEMTDGY